MIDPGVLFGLFLRILSSPEISHCKNLQYSFRFRATPCVTQSRSDDLDSPTDTQLAHSVLKKFNRITIYLSLFMVVLFAMAQEEGLFGLKASMTLQSLLAFDVSNPFRTYGTTVFSSLFIHAGLQHLVSNVFWLMLVGLYIENMQGKKTLVSLLLTGHFLGLIVSFFLLQGHVKSTDNLRLVLGSSAAILCLIGYAAVFMRRFFGYCLSLLLMSVIIWPVLREGQPAMATLNHLVPFLGGLVIGVLTKWKATPA